MCEKKGKPVARSLHNNRFAQPIARGPDQTPSRSHFIQNANDLRSYTRLDRVVSETWFSTDYHLMPKVQLSPERLP